MNVQRLTTLDKSLSFSAGTEKMSTQTLRITINSDDGYATVVDLSPTSEYSFTMSTNSLPVRTSIYYRDEDWYASIPKTPAPVLATPHQSSFNHVSPFSFPQGPSTHQQTTTSDNYLVRTQTVSIDEPIYETPSLLISTANRTSTSNSLPDGLSSSTDNLSHTPTPLKATSSLTDKSSPKTKTKKNPFFKLKLSKRKTEDKKQKTSTEISEEVRHRCIS
jgi:hypothetical protein